MENRFMEMSEQLLRISARGGRESAASVASRGYARSSSFEWERPQSAAQRALVILIENGGVDLGIPELVDHILG